MGCAFSVVDPLVVALVAVGVGVLLLRRSRRAPFPRSTRIPAVEENAERAIERPQLDELVRRDVDRAQGRARARRARRRHAPTRACPSARRIFPGAVSIADEAIERLVPLVAPDLEVDVDDVVVGDREAAERYETVNVRVSSRASKCQTIRTLSPRCSTPKVPAAGPRLELGLVALLERDAALRDRAG